MKRLSWMLLIVAGPAFANMPNPKLTPGAIVPGVTLQQLCKPGYAASVRHVPQSEKNKVYQLYGLKGPMTGYCAKTGCEVDHLISLELGGSNDLSNLWIQPYAGDYNAHDKDVVENAAHKAVCAGVMDLGYAQRQIVTDWRVLGRQLSLKFKGIIGIDAEIPNARQAI